MAAILPLDYALKTVNKTSNETEETAWSVTPATMPDTAEIKRLFLKLHDFNSSLDPRFALSPNWESCFEEHLAELIEGKTALCWLARERVGGTACGIIIVAMHCDAALWRYREWAEIEALYIEKEWQGSGMAKELLEVACQWGLEKGQNVIQLYVTATNDRAINFYRRESFKQTQAIMRRVLE